MNDDDLMRSVGCLFIITFLVVLAVFGVGIWGFIELIHWVTSK